MISKGNHVIFARFLLLTVSEEAVRVISPGYLPQPSASADNPYLDLDYSGDHKNLIQ